MTERKGAGDGSPPASTPTAEDKALWRNEISEQHSGRIGAVLPGDDMSRLLAIIRPPGADDNFGWTFLEPDRAVVSAMLQNVFATVARYFGERETRELFHSVSKGKPARPRKLHLSASDRELLAIYDARVQRLTPHQVRALPREVATERATNMRPAGATEKHLRRLLKQREADQAAEAAHILKMRRIWSIVPKGDL